MKPSESWRGAQTAGRDLVRFGAAIFVAAGFSAVQVFVIPRLLDVTTYGQYRLFLVYIGYVALLHLGVADGAFLRWVGRSPTQIAAEWPVVLRWIIAIHAVFVTIALAVALTLTSADTRTFIIAIALGATCVNASLLGAYALQAAGDFTRAGRAAILSNGLFVALALVTRSRTLASVLGLFVAAFGISAFYGAWSVRQMRGQALSEPEGLTPRALMVRGAPVLGASIAAALAQSVDRLLVSFFAPIESFALYGFASTASVAAASATQALSRVALSHAARREESHRAAFLAGYYDVIATGFGLALLALPLFDHLVASHIPAYRDALPIVRALTLGLPAWVGTHVVIVGTLQSYGLVRRQLVVELSGVVLVSILSVVALIAHAPLWFVAGAASAAAVLTLLLGALLVYQSSAPTGMRATAMFVAVTTTQAGALLFGVYASDHWLIRTATYAIIAVLPTLFATQRARSHGW